MNLENSDGVVADILHPPEKDKVEPDNGEIGNTSVDKKMFWTSKSVYHVDVPEVKVFYCKITVNTPFDNCAQH